MRAIRNRALTPIFLVLLAGCGGGDAVKMYEGDEKAREEVATVRLWSQDLSVVAIDGKPTPRGRATHAQVDAGEHEFTLAHVASTGRFEPKLRTLTRAGRTYVFGAKEVSLGRYSYFVEDKGREYDADCLKPEGRGKNC